MNYIAKQVVETEDAVGRESKVDESRKFGEFCSHQEIASEIRQSIRTEVSTRSGYISSKLEGNLLANSALGFAFTAATQKQENTITWWPYGKHMAIT